MTFVLLVVYAIVSYISVGSISTDTFVLFTGMLMIAVAAVHGKNS